MSYVNPTLGDTDTLTIALLEVYISHSAEQMWWCDMCHCQQLGLAWRHRHCQSFVSRRSLSNDLFVKIIDILCRHSSPTCFLT